MGDMQLSRLSFALLAVSLLCSACTGSSNQAWKNLQQPELGISLSYPDTFTEELPSDNQVASGTGTFRLQQMRLRTTGGDAAMISILRSSGAELINTLNAESSLENVTVGGKEVQKFTMDGPGRPVGFVLQTQPSTIAVAFTAMEDQSIIERVIASVTLMDSAQK